MLHRTMEVFETTIFADYLNGKLNDIAQNFC